MDVPVEIKSFVDSEGRLKTYPAKRKKQLFALLYLAGAFTSGKVYTESEVNDVLNAQTVFRDPATIRRELCNYYFLERDAYGREYRLCDPQPTSSSLGIAE